MRTLIVLLFLLVTPPLAHAAQLDAQGCQVMAIWGRDLLWARDMGADRGKVRAWVEASSKETPVFEVLLTFFDDLWASKAEGVQVMQALYRDCLARRGNYGSAT